MSLNSHHKLLVRERLRQNPDQTPRKRRRKLPQADVVTIKSESSDDSDDLELEDVDLTLGSASSTRLLTPDIARTESNPSEQGDNDESEDTDDFEDLEDVDLDAVLAQTEQDKTGETLTFTISKKEEPQVSKKKFTPIPKQERHRRKLIHKLYLICMACHGALRNRWCNDPDVQAYLRSTVPPETVSLFHQEHNSLQEAVKARKVIDGLNRLIHQFHKRFKISRQGIIRMDWGELGKKQVNIEKVTMEKFRQSARHFTGSRDAGAQLFVALLRSIGVNARLVFSLQPPDYRSIRPAVSKTDERQEKTQQEPAKPKSEFDPVFIPNNTRQAFLSGIRSKTYPETSSKKQLVTYKSSKYPVFWIEVWNKHSRKWLTIDPVVFQTVEVIPKRKRSKFEPPASEESNQTWYVLAFDRKEVVKDVTRRYTQFFNAKTSKKRIAFASDEDEHWYERLMRAVCAPNSKTTPEEAMEMKEFHDRDICEGVPNSLTDFKNHPVYALESQLRSDEVIYPNDDSSKCGFFRSKTKDVSIPIFKRSHVFRLRPARSWWMRGRVLRVGVQPLKCKVNNSGMSEDSADDDGTIRLYAEFQTTLFHPPPIADGKIEKNAYGNVEIFTPTMMPENGFLVELSPIITMRMLERAARDILRIDYARAIVSFDFKNKLKNLLPTAKEGGILIDQQFKDAMLAIVEAMREDEEERKRKEIELNALRSWKFFLKKLQIVHGLNARHGAVKDEGAALPRVKVGTEDESEDYFSVGSDEADSDNENYVPRHTRRRENDEVEDEGGFMPEGEFVVEAGGGFIPEGGNVMEDEGGFVVDDEGGFVVGDEGGFVVEDEGAFDAEDEGGFIVEDEGGFAVENLITTSEAISGSEEIGADEDYLDGGFFKSSSHTNLEEVETIEVFDEESVSLENASPVEVRSGSEEIDVESSVLRTNSSKQPDVIEEVESTSTIETHNHQSVSSLRGMGDPREDTELETGRECLNRIEAAQPSNESIGRMFSPRSSPNTDRATALTSEDASLAFEDNAPGNIPAFPKPASDDIAHDAAEQDTGLELSQEDEQVEIPPEELLTMQRQEEELGFEYSDYE